MNRLLPVLTSCLAFASSLCAQRMLTVGLAAQVREVDLATGAATPLGTMTGILGATDDSVPAALAYDLVAGRLYAVSSIEDRLYVVDPTDWRTRVVGDLQLGPNFIVSGLEHDLATGQLFGVGSDGGAGRLFTVDAATGAATIVGPTGLTGVQSLAFDPASGELFVIDTTADRLYRVDRATGATSGVGQLLAATFVDGMAHCLDDLTMYAVDRRPFDVYQLTSVDLTTGAATAIGPTQPGNVTGMAYVLGTGRLLRTANGCGGVDVFVSGSPNLGGAVELRVQNATGAAFVGFGIDGATAPLCGCMVGHEWAVAVPGPIVELPLPASSSIVGVSVFAQGLDLGGLGGCLNPPLSLTDTIEVRVGS